MAKIVIEIKPISATHCIGCTCVLFKYPQGEGNVDVKCSAFWKPLETPEQFDRPLRLAECKAAEEEYNRLYEISEAASDFAINAEDL